jgi:cell division protein ZapA
MSEQATIKVVIGGTELSFRTDDPEYIRELADYVDKQIRKITLSDNVSEPAVAAKLAAFNIADELFTLRKEESGTAEEISRRLDTILEMTGEAYRSLGSSDKSD